MKIVFLNIISKLEGSIFFTKNSPTTQNESRRKLHVSHAKVDCLQRTAIHATRSLRRAKTRAVRSLFACDSEQNNNKKKRSLLIKSHFLLVAAAFGASIFCSLRRCDDEQRARIEVGNRRRRRHKRRLCSRAAFDESSASSEGGNVQPRQLTFCKLQVAAVATSDSADRACAFVAALLHEDEAKIAKSYGSYAQLFAPKPSVSRGDAARRSARANLRLGRRSHRGSSKIWRKRRRVCRRKPHRRRSPVETAAAQRRALDIDTAIRQICRIKVDSQHTRKSRQTRSS